MCRRFSMLCVQSMRAGPLVDVSPLHPSTSRSEVSYQVKTLRHFKPLGFCADAYAEASSIVSESLGSVRTVLAFNAAARTAEEYDEVRIWNLHV